MKPPRKKPNGKESLSRKDSTPPAPAPGSLATSDGSHGYAQKKETVSDAAPYESPAHSLLNEKVRILEAKIEQLEKESVTLLSEEPFATYRAEISRLDAEAFSILREMFGPLSERLGKWMSFATRADSSPEYIVRLAWAEAGEIVGNGLSQLAKLSDFPKAVESVRVALLQLKPFRPDQTQAPEFDGCEWFEELLQEYSVRLAATNPDEARELFKKCEFPLEPKGTGYRARRKTELKRGRTGDGSTFRLLMEWLIRGLWVCEPKTAASLFRPLVPWKDDTFQREVRRLKLHRRKSGLVEFGKPPKLSKDLKADLAACGADAGALVKAFEFLPVHSE